jgi:hypothetical protein
MSTDDSAAPGWHRIRSFAAARAVSLIALAFLVGLATGTLWFAAGAPPAPGAVPADLTPEWQRVWVVAVADDFARTGDADRALTLLDGIPDETAAAALADVMAMYPGDNRSDRAARLASALRLDAAGSDGQAGRAGSSLRRAGEGATGDGETRRGDAASGPTVTSVSRAIAMVVLVAALAAGAAIAWLWFRSKPGGVAPGAVPPSGDAARATRGGPPWRPSRIDVGDEAVATPDADDPQYYQTWLVHDEHGGLVGGAGVRAQPVGGVRALELWFFRRDTMDDDGATPTVLVVPSSAHADGVFRARLGDRASIPAVSGTVTRLRSGDLGIDVEVLGTGSTEAPPAGALPPIALRLSPRRYTDAAEPAAPSGEDDDASSDPPVPGPYRAR